MKISIGELNFKSKKAAIDYTRAKLTELIGDKIQDQFLIELVKNHPSNFKNINDIDYFTIRYDKYGYIQTECMLKSGYNYVFSWRICCELKEKTPKENIVACMRTSIRPDILKYRRENSMICVLCDTVEGLFHIDHNEPSFKILSDDFLEQNKNILPTDFTCRNTEYYSIFHNNDNRFRDEWIEFHNSKAKLQVLCQSCNLRKPK